MLVFDAHCDALLKLWSDERISFFQDKKSLHVTVKDLWQGGVKVQLFAIYIPERVAPSDRFTVALKMVEIFHERVLSHEKMKHVRNKRDIEALKEGEIGAMLTLEGCDAIGVEETHLKTLLRLGVSSVGLTWNHSNAVADGILEERGAGLSSFGRRIVNLLDENKVWTDVSHLSKKGFWDVMGLSSYPIASHSNAYSLCRHPRNLDDSQIRALISKNSMIGITFVPDFLRQGGRATVSDVLRHLDYVCSLGGERNVGFGSDFDGIDETVEGLDRAGKYDHLANTLLRYYKEEHVHRFLYQNFFDHLPYN